MIRDLKDHYETSRWVAWRTAQGIALALQDALRIEKATCKRLERLTGAELLEVMKELGITRLGAK